MITHRPCGVCRALVPPTGCRHWHPHQQVDEALAAKRDRNARAKRRERAAAREKAVADLTRALVPRPPVPAKRPPIVQRAAPVPRLRRTSTENPIGASVADLEQATGRSFR